MGVISSAALALALLAAPAPVPAHETPPLPAPRVASSPAVTVTAPEMLRAAYVPRTAASEAEAPAARQTSNRTLLVLIGLAVAVGALLVVAFG